MLIRPLPGVRRDDVARTLAEVSANATQITAHDLADRYRQYNEWALNSARALRDHVSAADIDRLILTRRYWSLQVAAIDDTHSTHAVLNWELDERRRALEAAKAAWRQETESWNWAAGKIVIADTNVFMEHRSKFDDIDWAAIVHALAEPVLLVIPLVVVDEFDKNKRSNERWRAAYSQSRLNSILGAFGTNDGASVLLREANWPSDAASGERDPRGEVRLRVLFDPPEHERLARADNEIVDRAVTIQAYTGRNSHIVTFDTGMVLRAHRAGLIVHQLGDQDRLEKPAKGSRRGRSTQAPSA